MNTTPLSTRAPLPLHLFVNVSELLEKEYFTNDDVFHYLGKSLNEWLIHILHQKGVLNDPVIHGEVHAQAFLSGAIYVAPGATVEPTAMIQGPCYIAAGAEVRHGAYIRGGVYVGPRAVVGHTTEVKGAVFFDDAKAGHFAYVGDAILGRHVNLGAGTKLANLKLKGNEVRFKHPTDGKVYGSGLRKFSSVLGDYVQTGCNSVISPGSLLLPRSTILPCQHAHGTIAANLSS